MGVLDAAAVAAGTLRRLISPGWVVIVVLRQAHTRARALVASISMTEASWSDMNSHTRAGPAVMVHIRPEGGDAA